MVFEFADDRLRQGSYCRARIPGTALATQPHVWGRTARCVGFDAYKKGVVVRLYAARSKC